MTNGKSLTAMKNYKYVTQGLLGMYEQGSKEHNWLKEKAPKWEELAESLYDVGCFVKSQDKRCPMECDRLLYKYYLA